MSFGNNSSYSQGNWNQQSNNNSYVPVDQSGDNLYTNSSHPGQNFSSNQYNSGQNYQMKGRPLSNEPMNRGSSGRPNFNQQPNFNPQQQQPLLNEPMNRGSSGRPNFNQPIQSGQLSGGPSTTMGKQVSTSSWFTVLETLPVRFTHSAISINEHLLVFGGFSGLLDESVIMLLHTTPTKAQMPTHPNFLEIKARGDIPEKKERASMAAVGKYGYIFGGYLRLNDSYYNSIHKFDPETLTFTVIAARGDLPVPRCGHCSVAVDDIMYMFGGRVKVNKSGFGAQAVEYLNDMHAFSTTTNTWRLLHTRGTPPLARSMASAVAVGRKIYIYGGAQSSGIKDTVAFCDLYCYDVDTFEWSEVEVASTLPIPCYGHSLNYIGNNRLLLFGGKATREWKEYAFGGNRLLKRWGHTATLHHGNLLMIYGGKGDDNNDYFNSLEIVDLEKELIELKPEDLLKNKEQDELDIQEWSKKSLEYLQVDIEELSSLLGSVVEGVLQEQNNCNLLEEALKSAKETQFIVQEKAKKFNL